MKLLVTGANGFLGQEVVAALQTRGHAVRALVRPAARTDNLSWLERDVEIVRADLRAPGDLAAAFDGIDVVVHLAAAVTGSEELQFASTVVGTENLLAAMQRSGVKSLVLASSFSVYDWQCIDGQLTEETPVEREIYARDGYAIAKIWQERLVRRVSAENGWSLIVLRPGFIWGRGNAFVAGLGETAGSAHVVVAPLARLPLTHVRNCADAFALAAESTQKAAGETFNIVDGHAISSWEFVGRYLRARGSGFRIPCPYAAGLAAAHVASAVSRAAFGAKGKLPGLLVPKKFRARFRPISSSPARISKVLGWTPPLGLAACLADTFGDPPAKRTAGLPASTRHVGNDAGA